MLLLIPVVGPLLTLISAGAGVGLIATGALDPATTLFGAFLLAIAF